MSDAGATYDLGREPKDLRVAGQWSVDLDQHLDIQRFEELFPDLCEGIARAMPFAEPVVIGSKESQYDMSLSEVKFAMGEHEDDDRLKRLRALVQPNVAYEYTKYRWPTMALGKKILLRSYGSYHNNFALKHLERINKDLPAYVYFPKLRAYLNDINAFDEIGRIIIFLTEGHAPAQVHCDYADGKTRHDQFLWFNPGKRKRFYVLDNEFKKQYLTGVCNTFDNATWHGGDPTPYATFTIRVDGLLSQPFLEKTGLAEHFKPAARAAR